MKVEKAERNNFALINIFPSFTHERGKEEHVNGTHKNNDNDDHDDDDDDSDGKRRKMGI